MKTIPPKIDLPCPSAPEAERALLGSLILAGAGDGELIAQVIKTLHGPNDFEDQRCRAIFEVIVWLFERDGILDPVSIAAELRTRNILEHVGGTDFVIGLGEGVPVAEHASIYAKQVREVASLRWAADRLHALIHHLHHGDTDQLAETLVAAGRDAGYQINGNGRAGRLVIEPMADMEPENPAWLWEHWIHTGAVNILTGPGGIGKSTIVADIAARTTTGRDWPDGSTNGTAGDAAFISAEDSPQLGDLPKLLSCGGDPKRAVAITGVNAGQQNGWLNLVHQAELLDQVIDERPETRLIVIDPLQSFIAGKNTHREDETREALRGLYEWAKRHKRVAVIGIKHDNKGGSATAVNRMSGSHAFKDYCRSVLSVIRRNDDGTTYLSRAKSNYAREDVSLPYAIRVDESGEMRRQWIEWKPAENITADELVSDEPSKVDEAADWLAQALGPLGNDGMEASKLVKAAEEAGHARRTLYRARKRAGVVTLKVGTGFGAASYWKLNK